MPIDSKRFEQLISEIATKARNHGAEVDETFALELRHYADQVGVRDLFEDDAVEVLDEIGTVASKRTNVLNGSQIRAAIDDICFDGPFNICASAAYKVLRSKQRDAAADRLKQIVYAEIAKVKING